MTTRPPANPAVRPLEDRKLELTEDYVVLVPLKETVYRIKVRKGFVFDGGTKLFNVDKGLGAYAVHDFLYRHRQDFLSEAAKADGVVISLLQGSGWGWRYDATMSRATADKIFKDILKQLEEPAFDVHTRYWAVRLFGGWVPQVLKAFGLMDENRKA